MKEILRERVHGDYTSHDTLIVSYKETKAKITYEASNATERCTTEFFDGTKWNHIFSLSDMGISPNKSAYISSQIERQTRAENLFGKAKEMIISLIGGEEKKEEEKKKEIKLVQGKRYRLKYSGQFCHIKGDLETSELEKNEFIFIGQINLHKGAMARNIFYCIGDGSYVMFSTGVQEYVVSELED